MLFVHTLRGQYDYLQGSGDVLWQRQVVMDEQFEDKKMGKLMG